VSAVVADFAPGTATVLSFLWSAAGARAVPERARDGADAAPGLLLGGLSSRVVELGRDGSLFAGLRVVPVVLGPRWLLLGLNTGPKVGGGYAGCAR